MRSTLTVLTEIVKAMKWVLAAIGIIVFVVLAIVEFRYPYIGQALRHPLWAASHFLSPDWTRGFSEKHPHWTEIFIKFFAGIVEVAVVALIAWEVDFLGRWGTSRRRMSIQRSLEKFNSKLGDVRSQDQVAKKYLEVLQKANAIFPHNLLRDVGRSMQQQKQQQRQSRSLTSVQKSQLYESHQRGGLAFQNLAQELTPRFDVLTDWQKMDEYLSAPDFDSGELDKMIADVQKKIVDEIGRAQKDHSGLSQQISDLVAETNRLTEQLRQIRETEK